MQERRALRYAAAAALLERARVVTPAEPRCDARPAHRPRRPGRLAAAERAARDILRGVPDDPEATRVLAYALVRQDRTREAIESPDPYLEGRQDPVGGRPARPDHARPGGRVRLCGQQTLSPLPRPLRRRRPRRRRAGGAARARAPLRHPRSDVEPPAGGEPIPVILLSEQSYYDSTGAPAWSGGQFDSFDGRIRIPIGGLTPSLDPVLDETVLHELTHAFVADRSAGLAPREIQEGVAQLIAGHHGADAPRRAGAAGARERPGRRRRRLLSRLAGVRRGPRGPARPGRDQRAARRDVAHAQRRCGLPRGLRQGHEIAPGRQPGPAAPALRRD